MPEMIQVSASDFAAIVAERDALQRDASSLQQRMSAMTANSLPRMVREFHFKFGHPVAWRADQPIDAEVIRFRLRLIAEEFVELLDACLDHEKNEGSTGEKWRAFIANAVIKVNLPELVDALADLEYVIEGTRATLGINGRPIMEEVHRANMAKIANGPDGKPVKPEGWTPPDIERVLRAQGWRG